MGGAPLSRAAGHVRAAAPVRLVHLGLGNFFRAHQAWYTDRAPDGEGWGIAAFAGRSRGLADALDAQDGLYTLVTRAAGGDRFDLVSSVVRAHAPADHDAWLGYLASGDVAALTVTVTEAGYLRRPDGGLDVDHPDLRADIEALRRDPRALVSTAPARLLAGIAARRHADAGPLAIVPCDNVAGNGDIVTRVLDDLAGVVAPDLVGWMQDSVSIVTTMVDRITPRTAPDDVAAVLDATGLADTCPVVTEPFDEWVLSGSFPAGRPRWDAVGPTFTDDITPHERRKLWLLNGAHSLLAHGGSIRGHTTVDEAMADDVCGAWVEEWWAEAARHLPQPAVELESYRAALRSRFANPRIRHLLAQIAADGSQKLPVRILPVLRAERAAGRLPTGATRVLAAWVCHLRGAGAPVDDARADEVVPLAAGPLTDAARRVLDRLDPAVGADAVVVATVVEQAREMASGPRRRRPTRRC